MKWFYRGFSLILVIVLGGTSVQAETQIAEGLEGRWIQVVGKGNINMQPDVARTKIGIRVEGFTVRGAMEKNRERMARIMDALGAAGIEASDIATKAFDIRYERPSEKPQAKGKYWINNMLRVTIRDLEKIDEVLDSVTEAGANQVWGIEFSLDDIQDVAAQARRAAVAQALTKAKALASACDNQLGKVLRISEMTNHGAGMLRSQKMDAGSAYISPGELLFSTQVQVIYALE